MQAATRMAVLLHAAGAVMIAAGVAGIFFVG
jgi:hypothetical protein